MYCLYGRCRGVWRRAYAPGIMGEAWFDHCEHVPVLRALWPTSWFVAEALHSFVAALEVHIPAYRLAADAPAHIERAAEALSDALPEDEFERALLRTLHDVMREQARTVTTLRATLDTLRTNLATRAVERYGHLRDIYQLPPVVDEDEAERVWTLRESMDLDAFMTTV
jgi:hypothetical protein